MIWQVAKRKEERRSRTDTTPGRAKAQVWLVHLIHQFVVKATVS